MIEVEIDMITSRLPSSIQDFLFHDAEQRDPVTARRAQLVRILLRERYLTRETLVQRVEAMLGFACFGQKSWKDNFYRDMRVVKEAIKQAGSELKYSRNKVTPGYYLAGEASLNPDVKREISGALQEIDQRQIDIYKRISPAQKFYQACSIINMSKKVSLKGNSLEPGLS